MSVKLFNLVKNYFAWMHDDKREQHNSEITTWSLFLLQPLQLLMVQHTQNLTWHKWWL